MNCDRKLKSRFYKLLQISCSRNLKLKLCKLPLASASGSVLQKICGFSRIIKKPIIRIALAKALKNYFNFCNSAKAFLYFQSFPLAEASCNLSGKLPALFFYCSKKIILLALLFLLSPFLTIQAQITDVQTVSNSFSIAKYLDQTNGKTADELVAYALANNAELEAVRRETQAAEALVRQADLRANPTLEVGAAKNPATPSRSVMVKGSLPLELYGRRGARVRVAERELEVRQKVLADRERLLAAEVRSKFGMTLALALKLQFVEETLKAAAENYELVSARVDEGRTAPLEQNMELVELNRIRAMRETSEGQVEISLLELKNMVGMPPGEILRLRGDFAGLLNPLPPQTIAVEQAVSNRPDLETARALENLAEARIGQARAEGKLDASVSAGYERMRQGFPQRGFDDNGQLTPIRELANVFSVGVTLELPIFNKNQGAIEAAVLEKQAAGKRIEFGELTVRREVAAAYIRYERAARAMEIYRVGVERQAETNLGVVRQTYELGSKTLLDYIAELRRFIEIKDDFIDAQLETYLARVEILKAAAAPELTNK
ncbi:TolC family protein [soil metagenome]